MEVCQGAFKYCFSFQSIRSGIKNRIVSHYGLKKKKKKKITSTPLLFMTLSYQQPTPTILEEWAISGSLCKLNY